MAIIKNSELSDAHKAIAGAGFKVSDFTIEGQEDAPESVDKYHTTGSVTITHRNGVGKSYAVGTMSSWAAEFTIDLEAGVYGHP
jgi:uncharacterized protein